MAYDIKEYKCSEGRSADKPWPVENRNYGTFGKGDRVSGSDLNFQIFDLKANC